MKVLNNKQGFTLVELLSVIVILSVVVLIATNAVIPAMDNAKKNVLAMEANTIYPAAQTLYVQENLTGEKCFSYEEIIKSGLIEKNDDAYTGSILVDESGKVTIWLSNGTNLIDGKSPDVTGEDVITSSNEASTVCGVSED